MYKRQLYNHIRGLIDWPMPYGVIDGKRIKFCKVRMRKEDHQARPGEILGFKNHAMEVASIGAVSYTHLDVYKRQIQVLRDRKAFFENEC